MTENNGSSYRTSHLAKGREYHDAFFQNPRRALMWQMEQRVLTSLVENHLGNRQIRHLDFACGTGRVLSFLQDLVNESTGIDVSASMLEVAKDVAPKARIIEGDISRDDVLVGEQFDLITAFRFFPKAEPELRDAVMSQLVKRIAPGGILIFNNHCHTGSLGLRLVKLIKGPNLGISEMSFAESRELIAHHQLETVGLRHLGLLPDFETRLLRPRWLVELLERGAQHLPLATLAEEHIIVCAKKTNSG